MLQRRKGGRPSRAEFTCSVVFFVAPTDQVISQRQVGGSKMPLGALRTCLFAMAAAMIFATSARAVQWVGKFDPLSVLGSGLFQYGDDSSCGTDGLHGFSALCDPVILS